jgi:amidohydrolase family protein
VIIDSQIHEPGPHLAWPEDPEARNRVLTEIALAWMDSAGVDRAVLHPSSDWGEYAATQLPDTFAYVPAFLPRPGEPLPDFPSAVDELLARPGVRAVRLIVGYPPTGENIVLFEQGAFEPLLAACEQRRVPLFLFATGCLRSLPAVIESHPDLTMVVDHFGLPQPPVEARDEPPWKDLDLLLDLAPYPNVYVKVCGAIALSESGSPFADVWPHLDRVIAAFGADRLLWASDQSRFLGRIGFEIQMPDAIAPYVGKHTYAQSIDLFRSANHLSDDDKALILGGTVMRLLDWGA